MGEKKTCDKNTFLTNIYLCVNAVKGRSQGSSVLFGLLFKLSKKVPKGNDFFSLVLKEIGSSLCSQDRRQIIGSSVTFLERNECTKLAILNHKF